MWRRRGLSLSLTEESFWSCEDDSRYTGDGDDDGGASGAATPHEEVTSCKPPCRASP